eukprot:scaffold70852_cov13-Tisochrysis_lutea.AAC.1
MERKAFKEIDYSKDGYVHLGMTFCPFGADVSAAESRRDRFPSLQAGRGLTKRCPSSLLTLPRTHINSARASIESRSILSQDLEPGASALGKKH